MNKEDKELLLKDLSARLPFGVKVHDSRLGSDWTLQQMHIHGSSIDNVTINFAYESEVDNFIPYLRSMSSMTSDEGLEYISLKESVVASDDMIYFFETYKSIDWLNKKMFDYRGLIEKKLALEAPEGTYKL